MKKILGLAAIIVAVCFIFIPAGISEQAKTITVQASESAKEAMKVKGPDLYIRIGIYRGY